MAEPEMPTAAALSAMAAQLEDLVSRAEAGARATDRAGTEAASAALYDAERALRTAKRAVDAASRRLG